MAYTKERLLMLVMAEVIKGKGKATSKSISKTLKVPEKDIEDIVNEHS